MSEIQEQLRITAESLSDLNRLLLDRESPLMRSLLDVVRKYGTPEEINRKAEAARYLPYMLVRLEKMGSPYLNDLKWLIDRCAQGAFITVPEYRCRVLGHQADRMRFDDSFGVTLEISALQYFPWLIVEARQALERGELMPGRFVRVRQLKESEQDQGDLIATAAAMQVIGASYVETLDTKGTDGSNIHLDGPDTLAGYFGGIGQPNEHALRWVDEFLYYYTRYGIRQVLNINAGTILLGYLLYRLGVDIQFKVSVFVGNDNPYSVLWTLLAARLLARPDGTTPLAGLNLSNSVNAATIELCAAARAALNLEAAVRLEHHVTETWKGIVRQPYNRRAELVELAGKVRNLSAKHEGGEPEVEQTLEHPSDVRDYFREKAEIEARGEMGLLERNYMEKHASVNLTARALTEQGRSFVAARNLHHALQEIAA